MHNFLLSAGIPAIKIALKGAGLWVSVSQQNSNLETANRAINGIKTYEAYSFTAANDATINDNYKIIRIGDIAIANIYVSKLPTVTTDGWITVATMPIMSRANISFDADIISGLGTSPIIRDGLVTLNNINVYITATDSGKRFRAVVPFIILQNG